MDNDTIAIFLALNSFIYIVIDIILDLRLLLRPQRGLRQKKAVYSPWNKEKPCEKYFLLLATLYFWLFFILWPIFHFFDLDAPFLAFLQSSERYWWTTTYRQLQGNNIARATSPSMCAAVPFDSRSEFNDPHPVIRFCRSITTAYRSTQKPTRLSGEFRGFLYVN